MTGGGAPWSISRLASASRRSCTKVHSLAVLDAKRDIVSRMHPPKQTSVWRMLTKYNECAIFKHISNNVCHQFKNFFTKIGTIPFLCDRVALPRKLKIQKSEVPQKSTPLPTKNKKAKHPKSTPLPTKNKKAKHPKKYSAANKTQKSEVPKSTPLFLKRDGVWGREKLLFP